MYNIIYTTYCERVSNNLKTVYPIGVHYPVQCIVYTLYSVHCIRMYTVYIAQCLHTTYTLYVSMTQY